MSIKDIAVQQFATISKKWQHITVDKWKDKEGKPITLYFKPFTLGEKEQLYKRYQKSEFKAMVYAIILKSHEKDGDEYKKIWDQFDEPDFMTRYDSDIVLEIGSKIIEGTSPDEYEKK